MWSCVYIASAIILLFTILYDGTIPSNLVNLNDEGYYVSLITLKNKANAPFYYHTALELFKKGNTSDDDMVISYGFYPDYSKFKVNNKVLKAIYRFVRPFYPMSGKIRSPDILYEGSEELNILPGRVVYKETYSVTQKEWLSLKYGIAHSLISNDLDVNQNKQYSMPLYYSYLGSYLSDNCSSWVRKLLSKYLNANISCKSYGFTLFNMRFSMILSFFDFPAFCQYKGFTNPKLVFSGYTNMQTGYTNITNTR